MDELGRALRPEGHRDDHPDPDRSDRAGPRATRGRTAGESRPSAKETIMKLTIFGATGRIGGHPLTWALAPGHHAHVLAPPPGALRPRGGLTLTPGAALAPAAAGGRARGPVFAVARAPLS